MRPDTKVALDGDRELAKEYIGEAFRQLNILDSAMNFQKLEQGARRVRVNKWTTIEVGRCFRQRKAYIYVIPHHKEEEEGKYRLCFCCRCWANGYIRGYTRVKHTCDIEGCKDPQVTYDVLACQKVSEEGHFKGEYKLFQGCMPTDFAHYRLPAKPVEGEQILLMVGRGIPCCKEDKGKSACSVGVEDGYSWEGKGLPLFYVTPVIEKELPKKYGNWKYNT